MCRRRRCSQIDAPPQSAHRCLWRPWEQIDDPPHSLHVLLRRPCVQMDEPPQSLHRYRWRPWGQTRELRHDLHECRPIPCLHDRDALQHAFVHGSSTAAAPLRAPPPAFLAPPLPLCEHFPAPVPFPLPSPLLDPGPGPGPAPPPAITPASTIAIAIAVFSAAPIAPAGSVCPSIVRAALIAGRVSYIPCPITHTTYSAGTASRVHPWYLPKSNV